MCFCFWDVAVQILADFGVLGFVASEVRVLLPVGEWFTWWTWWFRCSWYVCTGGLGNAGFGVFGGLGFAF